jgi:hypothetical protein
MSDFVKLFCSSSSFTDKLVKLAIEFTHSSLMFAGDQISIVPSFGRLQYLEPSLLPFIVVKKKLGSYDILPFVKPSGLPADQEFENVVSLVSRDGQPQVLPGLSEPLPPEFRWPFSPGVAFALEQDISKRLERLIPALFPQGETSGCSSDPSDGEIRAGEEDLEDMFGDSDEEEDKEVTESDVDHDDADDDADFFVGRQREHAAGQRKRLRTEALGSIGEVRRELMQLTKREGAGPIEIGDMQKEIVLWATFPQHPQQFCKSRNIKYKRFRRLFDQWCEGIFQPCVQVSLGGRQLAKEASTGEVVKSRRPGYLVKVRNAELVLSIIDDRAARRLLDCESTDDIEPERPCAAGRGRSRGVIATCGVRRSAQQIQRGPSRIKLLDDLTALPAPRYPEKELVAAGVLSGRVALSHRLGAAPRASLGDRPALLCEAPR